MGLLSLEQDRALVRADFAFYGVSVAVAAGIAALVLPAGAALQAVAWVLAGALGWTLAEYALHRFVLHGLPPFKGWHALHHQKPFAFIATPTLLTAALFALLVLWPAWWFEPTWIASAQMLGVLAAYLAYIVTHHAVHHARGNGAWLRRQKRWHALHHRAGSRACYGVSLPLWDHVFGTARPEVGQRTDPHAPRR